MINDQIGRWVKYTDGVGRSEYGRVKSANSRFVFVVFKCDNQWDRFQDFTGCACNPENLILMPEGFTL
jgi:hypothetical protein